MANMHRHAKFNQNRSNGCGDIAFNVFSKWRPSAILDFFGIFWTAFMIQRAKMRQHTKFCRNRWNRCWDIAIYCFFFSHDFVFVGQFWDDTQREFGGFIIVHNLVGIVLVIFIIHKFDYLAHFPWKRLFMPLFGCFWGKNWGKWKLPACYPSRNAITLSGRHMKHMMATTV